MRNAIRIELTPRTAILAVCSVAAVWLLVELWPILIVIVGALMIAGMLTPIVDWLERHGLKRSLAVVSVFASFFIIFTVALGLTVPRLVSQIGAFAHRLPQLQAELATKLDETKVLAPLSGSVRELHAQSVAGQVGKLGWAYSGKVVSVVAYGASTLFLSLYLLLDRDRMRGALFAVVPRNHHVRLSRILLKLQQIVGGYLRGQIITSALMAVFTFAVLTIARVPNALALSLFAGIADVLPYVGAFLVCGPAFLVALSKGMTTAIIVLAVLAAYQEFESRFIVPRVYGDALRLPASVVMVSLLVGGTLLGIIGALIALPIAAAIRMMIEELRVDLPGEDVDDSRERAREARDERAYQQRAAGAPVVEAAAIATEIASHHAAK